MRRLLGVGLRPRLLAALVLTAAITLGVAAIALLGPLEQRLQADTTSSLVTAALEVAPSLTDAVTLTGGLDQGEIARTAHDLARRTGARVALVDAGGGRVFDTDDEAVDPFDDVRLALARGHTVHDVRFGRLRVVVPLRILGQRYALAVRKRLTDVSAANRVVRDAFLKAAAVGLLIALLLGIGLSRTLLRRLQRLRDAARELENQGLDAPAPVDQTRDEVGDLGRTFASMQSRLRRQEAARRAFVATASHELRTPLASLDGMLELLAEDLNYEPLDLEDARQRTIQAREQSRRLSHLAADLLDLSRLDAVVELRSEPVELAELARAVMAEFERRAEDGSNPLASEAPDHPVWALGDPGSFARIVRILIDNALRISPPGAPVTVEIADSGERPRLSVRDHGPGVAARDREVIFERFQRGSTSSGEGFGLGLAIARELSTRMGATLELAEVDTGACFVLSMLPAPVTAAVAGA